MSESPSTSKLTSIPRDAVALALLLASGCIFSSGDPSNGDGVDGGSDVASSDMSGDEDTGSGEDMSVDPGDAGTDDVGGRDSSMPNPEFEVVRRIALSFSGDPASPPQVARFRDGFLVGYSNGTTVHVGWFTEDRAVANDTWSNAASGGVLDLAGWTEDGFATFLAPTGPTVTRLQRAPQDSLSAEVETYLPAAGTTYHELAIAAQQDDDGGAFTAEARNYDGADFLDIGAFGPNGYVNTGAPSESVRIRKLELLEGAASGTDNRLFAAGVADGTYQLFEYYDDGQQWVSFPMLCGDAPANGDNPRIVPLGGPWTLVRAPTNGDVEWRVVNCVAQETPAPSPVEVVPELSNGEPTVSDFDIAEESAVYPSIGVAWLEEARVRFGLLTLDPADPSARITDAIQVPEFVASSVRTAYNPDRDTYAIVAERTPPQGGVELFFIKRQSGD